jgi:hypothetical protein
MQTDNRYNEKAFVRFVILQLYWLKNIYADDQEIGYKIRYRMQGSSQS